MSIKLIIQTPSRIFDVTDIVTDIAWTSDGQLLSCSDDKDIKRWGADGFSGGKLLTLPAYPSSMSFNPLNSSGKVFLYIYLQIFIL